MAQRQHVVITDDLDGSENANGYTFAFNGTTYEIDLGDANRDKLIEVLQPFIEVARKTSSRGGSSARRAPASNRDANEGRAARAWAREQGIAVPARGRVPREILDKFRRSVN